MYSRILVATDGSELADRGLTQGLALAGALGSAVIVLTVSEPWTPLGADLAGMGITEYTLADEYEKVAAVAGAKILADAQAAAGKAGVPCETAYVSRRFPADAIIEEAARQGAELIVMASHGRRGIGRLVLGSQAQEVLTHSTVPVLVIR